MAPTRALLDDPYSHGFRAIPGGSYEGETLQKPDKPGIVTLKLPALTALMQTPLSSNSPPEAPLDSGQFRAHCADVGGPFARRCWEKKTGSPRGPRTQIQGIYPQRELPFSKLMETLSALYLSTLDPWGRLTASSLRI